GAVRALPSRLYDGEGRHYRSVGAFYASGVMSREIRLGLVFGLNAALLIALAAVGLTAHSLGVLAAAGDYLADALAIGLSIFTIRLTRRFPTAKHSFGYERTTILAALVNASLVVATAAAVIVAAGERLATRTPHVHGVAVVSVSATAAVVMVAGALMLQGDKDLNVRSVLLDTAADAVTAACVAITGVVILVTGGLFWLDPVVALVVATIIGYRALGLLREVTDVLMDSTPKGLDVREVQSTVLEGGEISNVHDLHVWNLSSDVPLLSAHVVLVGHPTLEDAQEVIDRVKARLLLRFGIDHATLETEWEICETPDPHGAMSIN
ncbi:MAG: cation diffusion facilitator family transporter, partial [Nitrososphaerales archaeon]